MTVYCITNQLNGKQYVGVTAGPVAKRYAAHLRMSRVPNPRHTIHRALAKYGPDAFVMSVLETVPTVEALYERERYWIATLNTKRHGYNETDGGEGSWGRRVSSDTRQRIVAALTTHYDSAPNRLRISNAMRDWWARHPQAKTALAETMRQRMTGNTRTKGKVGLYTHTDGAKARIGDAHRGKVLDTSTREAISISRRGKGTGASNAMARPEARRKLSELAKRRRKALRPDGSWCWVYVDKETF